MIMYKCIFVGHIKDASKVFNGFLELYPTMVYLNEHPHPAAAYEFNVFLTGEDLSILRLKYNIKPWVAFEVDEKHILNKVI